MGVSTSVSITPLPSVPPSVESFHPDLHNYLQQQRLIMQQILQGHFTAIHGVTQAINKGTSGSFTITTAGHIHVTSGVITSVSIT